MSENEKMEQGQGSASASEKADKAKKDKKPEKQKKPSIFARIGKWLKDMKSELKKVQWPTRKQTINNTLIVIAVTLIAAVFIYGIDTVFGRLLQLIYKNA